MAVGVFNKCATEYQEKFMNVDVYKDSLDLFCDSIPNKNALILELACGPGNITKYLLNKRPGFKIFGIDLSANMLAIASISNPSAEFQLMDCRDIGKLGKKYDGIMCGFCLPYLSKEEAIQLIRDAAELLAPGGLIYISTMEDDYNRSGMQTSSSGDQLYVHYHQADYLAKALKENGLTIIDLRRQQCPANDGTIATDLLIIAGK